MVGFPSPFGGDDDDELFDGRDEFVPEHLPDPGPFLADQAVLADEAHVEFHAATREIFDERSVYDATFGYNLARLNLDTRHPEAGYRYAEETADASVLRAEFTPTTEFCPQSGALTLGAARAWNGLADRHGYDRVRVRLHPMHRDAAEINERLAAFESADGAAGGGSETVRGRDAARPSPGGDR
ncbi:hypothetical protein [Candidatus Halobonum tyrrellensis]|uniref:DUF7998 domain-containing protein n=1 Tax=Candidatus Halobonum tyrrellensis G22 TaxID=1324957 RepID=V4GXH7_9EURY|nr:hypothetical protein [Candidatus Halobonum tyrrellensis]ESP89846.1 hypothetical protein K933_02646 [Candidatus Halobonum tyrrellensis G22]